MTPQERAELKALNDKGVNEHVLRQNRNTPERLQSALRRIGTDAFGTCVRCSSQIPLGRLRRVPEALVCVSCGEKPRGG